MTYAFAYVSKFDIYHKRIDNCLQDIDLINNQ